MLRVIKVTWKAKSGATNFYEMLPVKLHLLWLLQNLMTALLMVPRGKPLGTALCTRVAGILEYYE